MTALLKMEAHPTCDILPCLAKSQALKFEPGGYNI